MKSITISNKPRWLKPCRYIAGFTLGIVAMKILIHLWVFFEIHQVVFSVENAARNSVSDNFVWTYKCLGGNCIKTELKAEEEPISMNVCMLRCNSGTLWPLPSGELRLSNNLTSIDPSQITVRLIASQPPATAISPTVKELVKKAAKVFKKRLSQLYPKSNAQDAKTAYINVVLQDGETSELSLDTDEAYTLYVSSSADGNVDVSIQAMNFFGARHGLETMSQLIVYDAVTKSCVVPTSVWISDRPKYNYRGVMLDTSRNYISVATIKNTLDAMSVNKLNTFHWHMTDSQSFPFVSKTFPLFSVYGAYSEDEVYREEDIREVVEYGRVRGVRVVPELDGPAHVGEGWQWASNATVCFKSEPWELSCGQPPCGQLDPTSEAAYSVLDGLLSDLVPLFPADLFHFGGDEVNIHCWNSTQVIVDNMAKMNLSRTEEGFLKLWSIYQDRVYNLLQKNKGPKNAILWTSSLTGYDVDKLLDKGNYIVQIWTNSIDRTITNLINKGFRVIFSNVDALYLDCGFGSWMSTGLNSCAPYNWWQKAYMNDPERLLKHLGIDFDKVRHLVLGGEAPLWSESVGDASVGNRIWPRGSALAEALWSGSPQLWQVAIRRLNHQRKRMEVLGFSPDMLQPNWCQQNQGLCFPSGY